MISFSQPLALLLALPLIAFVSYAWRGGYTNLTPRRLHLALGVRITIIAALVLGLAGLSLRFSSGQQATVFVADLSASDAAQSIQIVAALQRATLERPHDAEMGIVNTGKQPVVEDPTLPLDSFTGFQAPVDASYTNLAGGLELANALLPGDHQRRVVVISDGQQNAGDALAAARLLHLSGVRVDTMPVRVPQHGEVLVDSVDVPSQLRPREHFTLTVTAQSTVQTTAVLNVYEDRTLVGSRHVQVQPGINHYTFAEGPLPPGFHTYSVQIAPALDTQPQNNTGAAFTSVGGPPHVLVLSSHQDETHAVMASLRSTGIQADLRAPLQIAPDLGDLQRYAAIVIVDTAAEDLGTALMDQLVPYVRDLGRGLVVLGGQYSYSMGGYGGTPLETALPVRMDIPRQRSIPTTAVVLVIESLEENTAINISKEAGKDVVNLLTPQDLIAVNDAPYDDSGGWVVPMQHVTDKAAIDGAIDRMDPGDPDSYTPSLQSAYQMLVRTKAQIKHIILLGDGDAEDPAYQSLVERIHHAGITVSTVTTNGAGRNDAQTMQDIAAWGGGRNYNGDDPSRIPQIMLRETRLVARTGVVQGKFYPQELSANPMLRDITSVAPLYGYIATTPKPAGEIVLGSKKLDPVLAAWQLGLGRSVAWTSDAAGLWTSDWLRAPGANRFWANLVSWVLPPTGTGHLFIGASSSQGQGSISVSVPSSLGATPDVTARVVAPDLHAATISLEPTAPGQYEGSFPANKEGSYFITVESSGNGHAEAGSTGIAVPYSVEYRTSGSNIAFLKAIAAAGGGSMLGSTANPWADSLPAVQSSQSLTMLLWLLALILLPFDVGIRRLVISRRELHTLLGNLRVRRPAPQTAAPAVTPLGAVRAERAKRQKTAAAAPTARPPQNRPAPAVTVATQGASAPEIRTEDTSTASKLLAAKRRRR